MSESYSKFHVRKFCSEQEFQSQERSFCEWSLRSLRKGTSFNFDQNSTSMFFMYQPKVEGQQRVYRNFRGEKSAAQGFWCLCVWSIFSLCVLILLFCFLHSMNRLEEVREDGLGEEGECHRASWYHWPHQRHEVQTLSIYAVDVTECGKIIVLNWILVKLSIGLTIAI